MEASSSPRHGYVSNAFLYDSFCIPGLAFWAVAWGDTITSSITRHCKPIRFYSPLVLGEAAIYSWSPVLFRWGQCQNAHTSTSVCIPPEHGTPPIFLPVSASFISLALSETRLSVPFPWNCFSGMWIRQFIKVQLQQLLCFLTVFGGMPCSSEHWYCDKTTSTLEIFAGVIMQGSRTSLVHDINKTLIINRLRTTTDFSPPMDLFIVSPLQLPNHWL